VQRSVYVGAMHLPVAIYSELLEHDLEI
jgi:hypothetical protein